MRWALMRVTANIPKERAYDDRTRHRDWPARPAVPIRGDESPVKTALACLGGLLSLYVAYEAAMIRIAYLGNRR